MSASEGTSPVHTPSSIANGFRTFSVPVRSFVPMTPRPANPGLNVDYEVPSNTPVRSEAVEGAESHRSDVSHTLPAGGVSLNAHAQPWVGRDGAGVNGVDGIDRVNGVTGMHATTNRVANGTRVNGQALFGPPFGPPLHPPLQERRDSARTNFRNVQHVWGLANPQSIPTYGFNMNGSTPYRDVGAGIQTQPLGFPTMPPPHPLAELASPTFFAPANARGFHDFGAVGTAAIPRAPPVTFAPPRPDPIDLSKNLGEMNAKQLADLIKAGYANPGDEDVNDPLTGAQRRARTQNPPRSSTALLLNPTRPKQINTSDLDPAYQSELPVARAANTKGPAVMYYDADTAPLPGWWANLSQGIKPSLDDFFFSMPVKEACRAAVATNAGVVRIRGIPYSTPRSEINAFIGRNAEIVHMPPGSPYFAVHVIMERHTAKTMDAFVEFVKSGDAQYVVTNFNRRILNGRHPRIGDRQVEVEISSQEDLMQEIFPRARNVSWQGATPRVLANHEMYYPGVLSSGFTGFLQTEEMVMMAKHVDTPHRSPFANRALVRVYEMHISTIMKYPWHAHECINMTERRLLFDTTLSLTKTLMQSLRKTSSSAQVEPTRPTITTLHELTIATLTCPGFSELQKSTYITCLGEYNYGRLADSQGTNLKFGGVSGLSKYWPFQVLVIDPRAPEDLIWFFARLLREATTTGGQNLTLAQQHALRASGGNHESPFGSLKVDYGTAKTMARAGQRELTTIEALLRRVL